MSPENLNKYCAFDIPLELGRDLLECTAHLAEDNK